jgi:hypothetical protein
MNSGRDGRDRSNDRRRPEAPTVELPTFESLRELVETDPERVYTKE